MVKVDGILFRQDGWQRGCDSFYRALITHATKEEIDEIEKKTVIKKAKLIIKDLEDITYDQAVKIIEMFNIT